MRFSKSISQQRITVAGCGDMGRPMAKALLCADYLVKGFDVRPKEEFGDFAVHLMDRPEQISGQTDVLISVVRDERQSLDLFFEDQAVFGYDIHPNCLIISSTLSPNFIHEVRARLPKDVALIDAPMSGAVMAAEAASLTFMVGGDKEQKTAVHPLFEAMGASIFDMGPLGTGMIAKVMNNYITAAAAVATRQTLERAEQLGADKDKLLEVVHASSGQNWFASNFGEIYWSTQNYDPANTMGILEKDVRSSLAPFGGPVSDLDKAILQHIKNL